MDFRNQIDKSQAPVLTLNRYVILKKMCNLTESHLTYLLNSDFKNKRII